MQLVKRVRWWGAQIHHLCREDLPLIYPYALLHFVVNLLGMFAAVIGTSVFLTHVGGNDIPLAVLVATVFMVIVSMGFFPMLGKLSYPRLIQVFLIVMGIAAIVLRILFIFEHRWVNYSIFVLGESMIPISMGLFWALFGSYFTILEVKRFTSVLHIAGGFGGVIGSGLAMLLAQWVPTEDMLLILPAFCVGGVFAARYIYQTKAPLKGGPQVPQKIGRVTKFLSAYPIVIFLFLSVILLRCLDAVMKVEVLEVIQRYFGENEKVLTRFVGGVYTVANISIFGCVAVARPLVRKIGVATVNVIYPLVTVAALALFLVTDRSLIAAVLLALNYLALVPSVRRLIFNLNVIAVPSKFAGRVRYLMYAVFGPIGLILGASGVIALGKQVSPVEIVAWAVGVGVLAVLVGYGIGWAYRRTLAGGMRRGVLFGVEETMLVDKDEEEVLYKSMEPALEQVRMNSHLPYPLRKGYVKLVVDDYNHRVIDQVLDVLSAASHASTVAGIRYSLYSQDPRMRANAIETLSNLKPRRFVVPILKALELELSKRVEALPELTTEAKEKVTAALEQLKGAPDKWLQMGARAYEGEKTILDELLFYKGISLFQDLLLDDLIELKAQFTPAGKTVDLQTHFYLVRSGMEKSYLGEDVILGIAKPERFRRQGDLDLLAIPANEIRKFAKKHPEVLYRLAIDLSAACARVIA